MIAEIQVGRPRDVGVLHKFYRRRAADPEHLRTYGVNRRCACGTTLSRYNPGTECAACESRAARLAEADPLHALASVLETKPGRRAAA